MRFTAPIRIIKPAEVARSAGLGLVFILRGDEVVFGLFVVSGDDRALV